MKYLIIVLTFIFVTLAFAKKDVDFDRFNKEINQDIDKMIKHNPQSYETKDLLPSRSPASVDKIEIIKEENHDEMEEKTNTGVGKDNW